MTPKTFVFRTDASLEIGTGHVMRCVTLAHALRERGGNCRFICREHPGNLLAYIRAQGFEACGLSAPPGSGVDRAVLAEPLPVHAAWLGTDWEFDAHQTLGVLGNSPVHWLIVDHYSLDVRWEQAVRTGCRGLLVIDDLMDRRHDCDLLLDQNLGREPADYVDLVSSPRAILAGPQYALLRPEFAAERQYSLDRRTHQAPKRLLISMGGVDKDDATSHVLEALQGCPLPGGVDVTVVMGPHAPWLQHVREVAARMPWPTEVLVNVGNMAALMAESDVAIGAAGTTAWERCCLGLPSLTMVLGENQRDGAAALAAAGCVLVLGNAHALGQDLPRELMSIWGNDRLQAMQRACSAVTDGNGVARLVAILMSIDV